MKSAPFKVLLLTGLVQPLSVFADCHDGSIKNPLRACSLIELLTDILNAVLILAIPVIVFFIIYAGFLYVTGRGNPESISKAHRALLYAIIGGVIILGANVLIAVIEGTVAEITV